ncbi:MAG: hypothetical protein ACRC1O_05180 [Ralstonia mannitolilytica]
MKFLRFLAVLTALASSGIQNTTASEAMASVIASLQIVDKCTVASDSGGQPHVMCERPAPSRVYSAEVVPAQGAGSVQMPVSAQSQVVTIEF